jgi:hypothetical protein
MRGPTRKAILACEKRFRAAISAPGLQILIACAIVASGLQALLQSAENDGILIYVPVHQSSIYILGAFASCMTQARPVLQGERFMKRVDLLITTNGDHRMDQNAVDALQSALRLLKKGLPQISRVRLFPDVCVPLTKTADLC